MKGTFITIVVILGLGVAGYFFYASLQNLGNEETNYDFTAAEEMEDNSYEESTTEFQTETELEAEIEAQENQEAQAEEDFNDLENLDF